MIAAAGCMTAMHTVVRYLSADIHPFELVFFRSLFGLLALSPLFFQYGVNSFRTSQPRLQALRGLTGICATLAWFFGLSVVSLAEATALSFTNAIFGSVIAAVFLREHFSGRRVAAVLVGLIGVLIILRPGLSDWNSGTLIVLFSAMCWGASIVIIKQLSRTDTSVSIVAWFGIQLTLFSLPFAVLVWTWPSTVDYVWLGLMGILGTLGHLAMVRALRLMDAAAAFPLDFTRLIWAGLFGFIFFFEFPDLWTWIGAAIIITSTIIFLRREFDINHQ
ncbi:MAG: RNA polymerase subunit sigma-54 [Acidiferrobacteraceae bacterium]|nr:RNA polymerase subunit sigma-54 [Acidiferrobacteraceae bacterium]|tara:strand:+ start:5493 stop:6320 length:828 start_codon:yes stop_codon:yes gene_type:complete